MTDWNPNDPDATRVYYDLSKWTFDQQAELAAAMADAEIPHSWDDTELMVPEESEQVADLVIAEVEIRLGIVDEGDEGADDEQADVGPGPQPKALTEGEPTTEYDLDEWPGADRQALTHALAGAGIAFAWDTNVLLVGTTDESIVEELLDDIEKGEYIDVEAPVAGDVAEQPPSEVLTAFFLAGERLRRDPLDADGLEQLLAATDVADPEVPPFGVQPRLWQQTCELADQLADALVEDDEPDHDAAMAAAEALYDLLPPHG
ncbi:MAG: hypothetical protein JWN99_1925 [Ilumatobacteraceae bacterium]|nr:hypothetical protein [Ilumatobacteraceae bacterium]